MWWLAKAFGRPEWVLEGCDLPLDFMAEAELAQKEELIGFARVEAALMNCSGKFSRWITAGDLLGIGTSYGEQTPEEQRSLMGGVGPIIIVKRKKGTPGNGK